MGIRFYRGGNILMIFCHNYIKLILRYNIKKYMYRLNTKFYPLSVLLKIKFFLAIFFRHTSQKYICVLKIFSYRDMLKNSKI